MSGAWDNGYASNSFFWRLTKDEGEAAIAILRRAVERHPNYGAGHSIRVYAAGFGLCRMDTVKSEPQVR